MRNGFANEIAKMSSSLRKSLANGSLRQKFASECECDGLVHSVVGGRRVLKHGTHVVETGREVSS